MKISLALVAATLVVALAATAVAVNPAAPDQPNSSSNNNNNNNAAAQPQQQQQQQQQQRGSDADILSISGGGSRALVVGLGFIRELELHNIVVPPRNTQGLSGGSWCVVANEEMGAKEALQRLDAHMSAGGKLGTTFKGLKEGLLSKDLWRGYDIWRNGMVEQTIYAPLKIKQYRENGEALVVTGITMPDRPNASGHPSPDQQHEQRHEQQQSGDHNDTAAAPPRFVEKRKHDHACVLATRGSQMKGSPASSLVLECSSHRPDARWHLTVPQVRRLNPDGQPMGNPQPMNRDTQTMLSGLAWMFLQQKFKGQEGLPMRVELTKDVWARIPSKRVATLDAWDLGIRCPLTTTLSDLRTPGVSLMLDASRDSNALNSAFKICKRWWRRFGYKTKEQPVADMQWRGHTFKFSALSPELQKYVRIVHIHQRGLKGAFTGRKMIILSTGQTDNRGDITHHTNRLKGMKIIDTWPPGPAVVDLNMYKRMRFNARWFFRKLLTSALGEPAIAEPLPAAFGGAQ